MTDQLTITHTDAEGTLIDGTSRGDGSAEVLKANGWRWGRSLGLWFIAGSRGHLPRRHVIERTAQALRDAGFDVVVEVDATPADPVELERQRQQRGEQRAASLTARAQKAQQASTAHFEAAHGIAEAIPMGQPVLVGHHSEARHRRDLARMDAHMGKSVEADNLAQELSRKAQTAAAGAKPVNKVTLGNRIETLAAEVRKDERALAKLADQSSSYAERVRERIAHTSTQLDYARQQWRERVEAGEFVEYGPQMVSVGDSVCVLGLWRIVAKVSAKSCSVETGYSWTDRVAWHKVIGHRAAVKA